MEKGHATGQIGNKSSSMDKFSKDLAIIAWAFSYNSS